MLNPLTQGSSFGSSFSRENGHPGCFADLLISQTREVWKSYRASKIVRFPVTYLHSPPTLKRCVINIRCTDICTSHWLCEIPFNDDIWIHCPYCIELEKSPPRPNIYIYICNYIYIYYVSYYVMLYQMIIQESHPQQGDIKVEGKLSCLQYVHQLATSIWGRKSTNGMYTPRKLTVPFKGKGKTSTKHQFWGSKC